MKISGLVLFLTVVWVTLALAQTPTQGQVSAIPQSRPERTEAVLMPSPSDTLVTPEAQQAPVDILVTPEAQQAPVDILVTPETLVPANDNFAPVSSTTPETVSLSQQMNQPLEATDQQVDEQLVSPLNNFVELLAQRDGLEFQHQGRSYVWQDGVPFEKNEDGSLMSISPPEDLFVVDSQGQKWLSKHADGTVYINVAPKVWASINFANNSDIIEDSSKPVLDIFGSSLNTPALARHRLIVVGHTSTLGRSEYNLKLSRLRAQSVSQYLSENHGLDPSRLILHGYGENKPIADNSTEEGERLNRRVEFILLAPTP